jgi:protein phosphatase
VQRAIREANSRIYAESQQEAGRLQMGTTLTAVLLHGGRMTVGHVGDSRAYLIRGGQISQITEDHTWVGEQVKRGVLTPEEAAVSPFRNQIVRSVGTSDTTEADILTEPLVEGDIVLACSDGLADMVDDQTICATFVGSADLQGACDRLVELANQAGGRDNITVVAARYRDATEAGALSPTPEPESEK